MVNVCPRCGVKNNDNTAFCMNCGTKLPVRPPESAESTDF